MIKVLKKFSVAYQVYAVRGKLEHMVREKSVKSAQVQLFNTRKEIVQHPVNREHQAHKLHCLNLFYMQ